MKCSFLKKFGALGAFVLMVYGCGDSGADSSETLENSHAIPVSSSDAWDSLSFADEEFILDSISFEVKFPSSSSADSSAESLSSEIENGSSSSQAGVSSSSEVSSSSSLADPSFSSATEPSSSENLSSSETSSLETSSSSSAESSSSIVSSSSVELSSSSVTPSSSSIEYGTVTDTRDGKTYRIVKIGDYWWTAENMQYVTPLEDSRCYDNDCSKVGRLYSYGAASKACPVGWRLPSREEWTELLQSVSISWETTLGLTYYYLAGNALKTSDGWGSRSEGENSLGFSAIPSGIVESGVSKQQGATTVFWVAGSANAVVNLGVQLYESASFASTDYMYSTNMYSVRCIQKITDNYLDAKIMERGYYSCETYRCVTTQNLNEKQNYKEFLDSRDYQVYKVIVIDNMAYMAQNLNYLDDNETYSVCGGSVVSTEAMCAQYGRLYTWHKAMNRPEEECFSNVCNGDNQKSQGLCPNGWRLPTLQEIEKLLAYVYDAIDPDDTADTTSYFKSRNLWEADSYVSENNFGLSFIPTGEKSFFGTFTNIGNATSLWTSTEFDKDIVYVLSVNSKIQTQGSGKEKMRPIRCVREID